MRWIFLIQLVLIQIEEFDRDFSGQRDFIVR